MTKHPFDEEVTDRFVLALLTALAQGPIGNALLEVASGRRRVVVKQHATLSGWVIETEPVVRPPHDAATDSDAHDKDWRSLALTPGVLVYRPGSDAVRPVVREDFLQMTAEEFVHHQITGELPDRLRPENSEGEA